MIKSRKKGHAVYGGGIEYDPWFSPQGWIQRALCLGEFPRHLKQKKGGCIEYEFGQDEMVKKKSRTHVIDSNYCVEDPQPTP